MSTLVWTPIVDVTRHTTRPCGRHTWDGTFTDNGSFQPVVVIATPGYGDDIEEDDTVVSNPEWGEATPFDWDDLENNDLHSGDATCTRCGSTLQIGFVQ